MRNLFDPPVIETLPDGVSCWDEVRHMAEMLELETHAASMKWFDRWRILEPRLTELARELEATAPLARRSLVDEIKALRALLVRSPMELD